ncbi:MAG: type II secretion system protein [Alphaproteobacteria bacterium]|nr:type II secretion system protein [Alphaproteobacteria bacterium]
MKKLESGRSMVEMLGVLAIIGVLSVGGIAGYTLSMRRHRANGVADVVAKYALVVYGQCQQKILNGDANTPSECSSLTTFANAGIGDMPSGVSAISFQGIESDSGGVDTVTINTAFTDPKLCQALGAITGTGCKSNKNVAVKIKQN